MEVFLNSLSHQNCAPLLLWDPQKGYRQKTSWHQLFKKQNSKSPEKKQEQLSRVNDGLSLRTYIFLTQCGPSLAFRKRFFRDTVASQNF